MTEKRATRELEPCARHHLILIPGFGGFDALGSVLYYNRVLEVLRERRELCVHFFPNIPMAAVATRAEALELWIGKRVERGTIQGDDRVHLVGHSTGGLDIRQLLARLGQTDPHGILTHVDSVQCISTPHRGTNLARWAGGLGPGARCAVWLALRALQGLGSVWTGCLGRSLRCHIERHQAPDWLDAALDALGGMSQCQGGAPYQAARARGDYYTLLRWLENMVRDTAAIDDLRPLTECGCVAETPQTPARWPAGLVQAEAQLLQQRGIRARSIATVAHPLAKAGRLDLFPWLHRITAHRPQPALHPAAQLTLDPLLKGRSALPVDREANDGIVNTLSMLWPEGTETCVVEADHGDILGHYPQAQADGAYDLLRSQPTFTRGQFEEVWRKVRDWAVP